jgi:hypothetical protein
MNQTRCVVESGTSCARCLRLGRICDAPSVVKRYLESHLAQVQRPGMNSYSLPDSAPITPDPVCRVSEGPGLNSNSSSYSVPGTPDPSTTRGPRKSSNLPSVSSAVPLATVTIAPASRLSNKKFVVPDDQEPPSKRCRTGGHILDDKDRLEGVSSEDMEQLLKMYVTFFSQQAR